MKLRFRLSVLIAIIAVLSTGCSEGTDNVVTTAAPTMTEIVVTPMPTASIEPTITPTPTLAVPLDNCLERMQPFEGEEKKGSLSVIGVLDGHKVYGCPKESYAEFYGFDAVWPVWSKDSREIGNIRNVGLYFLDEDDYIFLSVTALGTIEVHELTDHELYRRWLEDGNTDRDWGSERGAEARRQAWAEASRKASEGFIEALYEEGCPIIEVGYYQAPYVTTIISKAKLLEIHGGKGESFHYLFYTESWLRFAEENGIDWIR